MLLKFLIIQENGRHERNRMFRECFGVQRALESLGHQATVWGLGHSNYKNTDDWVGFCNGFDVIILLEQYDESGWVPDLSLTKPYKVLWSIDAHCRGVEYYANLYHANQCHLTLQATPDFAGAVPNSVWFPNAYDDFLIKPLYPKVPRRHNLGFCGNYVNRKPIIDALQDKFRLHMDEMALGFDMVRAVQSYYLHWNKNMANDINYRNFETLGCGTCLVTSYSLWYDQLGMKDMENCVTYRCWDELEEKVNFLLSRGELIDKIGAKGLELAKSHSYTARMVTLLGLLKERL